MKTKSGLAWLFVSIVLFLTGCNYDVPLTAKPTRKIDVRLIGKWISIDQGNQKEESMQVRQLDDFTYVVAMDNDIYRAFHSDFADTAFLSVQDLNSESRKYLYFSYSLSDNGRKIGLRAVSTKIVPEKTKGRTELQRLIKANAKNQDLLGDTLEFTKADPGALKP